MGSLLASKCGMFLLVGVFFAFVCSFYSIFVFPYTFV